MQQEASCRVLTQTQPGGPWDGHDPWKKPDTKATLGGDPLGRMSQTGKARARRQVSGDLGLEGGTRGGR